MDTIRKSIRKQLIERKTTKVSRSPEVEEVDLGVQHPRRRNHSSTTPNKPT